MNDTNRTRTGEDVRRDVQTVIDAHYEVRAKLAAAEPWTHSRADAEFFVTHLAITVGAVQWGLIKDMQSRMPLWSRGRWARIQLTIEDQQDTAGMDEDERIHHQVMANAWTMVAAVVNDAPADILMGLAKAAVADPFIGGHLVAALFDILHALDHQTPRRLRVIGL